MLRADFGPRHRNRGRPPEKSCPSFLKWLRGRNCILSYTGGCDGKIVAAHVDYAGGKGIGTKVADKFAVPMCGGPNGHHAEQHRQGWTYFETKYQINALALASAFYQAWPSRVAWEMSR